MCATTDGDPPRVAPGHGSGPTHPGDFSGHGGAAGPGPGSHGPDRGYRCSARLRWVRGASSVICTMVCAESRGGGARWSGVGSPPRHSATDRSTQSRLSLVGSDSQCVLRMFRILILRVISGSGGEPFRGFSRSTRTFSKVARRPLRVFSEVLGEPFGEFSTTFWDILNRVRWEFSRIFSDLLKNLSPASH